MLLICSVPTKINDSDENMFTHAPLQCSCHPRASNTLKAFIAPKCPSLARALLTSRLRNPLADLIISSPRLPVPAPLKPALSTASQSHSSTGLAGRNACVISLPASSHSTSNASHKARISSFLPPAPATWSQPLRPLWIWQPPPNGRPALPSTSSLFSTQQPMNLQNRSQITALLHSDPLVASCFTQDKNLIRLTQLSAGPPAISDLPLSLTPPAPASPTPFHCFSVALGAPCSGLCTCSPCMFLTQMSLPPGVLSQAPPPPPSLPFLTVIFL